MELLSETDIQTIHKKCSLSKKNIQKWYITDYSDNLVGYLGEHLSLFFETESERRKFFIKCVPRFNSFRANYVRETAFFNKEYIMLSKLFQNFRDNDGLQKWRPKLLYVKEELFVFEDVTEMGYIMPSNLSTLMYDEILATIAALARFHAQSWIHEEEKSIELDRPYRLWEDYADYLSEPERGQPWRDTGMRAVIDFLKVYSKFRTKHNFEEIVNVKIPELYKIAEKLMKPSIKYRNVVVHRDVWSNNIFLKTLDNGKMHALLVDYQTVLYCAPAIDLSALIYLNTTKQFRLKYTKKMIDFYYEVLCAELELEDIDITSMISKCNFVESYTESLAFGMTQAALVIPMIAMSDDQRKEIFDNPETNAVLSEVSRSQEFIDVAKVNKTYKNRVIELFDDIVETFCIHQ
ncbi:uncharacterized protein LOC112044447 [Bicyclus anynana]|uniref:Uncharacterized protein LOC112044447 n=1 Tax=Bicyclus anynana TaxID=110368 RepID=A0A6J1MKN5_BICAN|nr:uncharacterized protein LOC112044447 [Bicyclus anynana]